MEEPGYRGGSNWTRLNATDVTPQRLLARPGPLTGTPGNKNIPANLRPLLLIVRCYALINSQCLFLCKTKTKPQITNYTNTVSFANWIG